MLTTRIHQQLLHVHSHLATDERKLTFTQYVRQEFQAHIKATPGQQAEFLTQWLDYAAHLATEAVRF